MPFTGTGHPDFSRYAIKKVQIEMTGTRRIDAKKANAAAGISREPIDYVWHHHHDGQTMLLIPENLHDAVRHTGGAAIVKSKK